MRWTFYTKSRDAWDAMLDACRHAEQTIYIEQYILDDDTIGNRFMDICEGKAKAGLDVRVLLDWWGCKSLIRSERFTQLKQSGVKVQIYNPPSFPFITRYALFPRDHRKILIVDGTTAFAGGVCMYDKITHWRDTMVKVGPGLAEELTYIFNHTWEKAKNDKTINTHPPKEGEADATLYVNAPDSDEYYLRDALMSQIQNAQHTIKLTTPYFTPGKRLMRALLGAMKRGVDVHIMLSDYSKYAPYVVGKHSAGRLIDAGALFYYYRPVMLHAKTMIIDEQWAAVGSCNLDGLSLHVNQEASIVTTNDEAVRTLSHHFDDDVMHAHEFTAKDWQARPVLQKICGVAFQPLKRFL